MKKIIILGIIIILSIIGYFLAPLIGQLQFPENLLGFGETLKVLTPPLPKGWTNPIDPMVIYQPAKTFWNWLELLFIPGFLAIIAVLYNKSEKERETEILEKQRNHDLEAESNRQHEETFQKYIDYMANLLLKEGLLQKAKDDQKSPVLDVARVKTISTLRALEKDKIRQNAVLQFIRDSNLSQYVLCNATLRDTDLSNLDFRQIDFSNSNISNCAMEASNFTKANFHNSTINLIDFTGATMVEVKFTDSTITRTQFFKSTLNDSDFSKSTIIQTSFMNLKLIDATFVNSKIIESLFDDVDLTGSDFSYSTLSNFYCSVINFSWGNLTGSKINSMNSSHSIFLGLNLRDCSINNCKLLESDFSWADFGGATVKKTEFQRSLFSDADFRRAVLIEVDFSETDILMKQLQNVSSEEGVILPKGIVTTYDSV